MDSAPWNQSVSESALQLRSDEDIYHHMGSIDLETGDHIVVRENNLHIELPSGTQIGSQSKPQISTMEISFLLV
jgi:hypothetical protein